MKTLVVYDSAYGNTRQIANDIGEAIGPEARVAHVEDIDADRLKGYEVVIVGSPTQGGRPTPLVREFLKRIPDGSLQGIGVTGFDTRIDSTKQGFVLRTFMGLLGYAAGRIARELEKKGGSLLIEPEGFLVDGKEGPLAPGEPERAIGWAARLARLSAPAH
jgi:flavodoxin